MELILKNIKFAYRKNKAIFILFIVIQIVITTSLIYVVSKKNSFAWSADWYDSELKTYTITSAEAFTADTVEENINELLKHADLLESVEVVGERFNYVYDVVSYPLNEQQEIENITSEYKYYSYSGFDETDYLGGTNSALYADVIGADGNRDKTSINLYGVDYEVKGITDCYYFEKTILPYKAMINNKVPIENIYIRFKDVKNSSEMSKYFSVLISVFPEHQIIMPMERDMSKEETMNNQKIAIIFMMLLSVISYAYLYVYMLNSRKRVFAVYSICGCSSGRIALLLFAETLLMSIAQFLVSVALYVICLKELIIKSEPFLKFTLNAESYLQTFVISVGIMLVVFTPIILSYSKQSINKLKKESE